MAKRRRDFEMAVWYGGIGAYLRISISARNEVEMPAHSARGRSKRNARNFHHTLYYQKKRRICHFDTIKLARIS